MTSFASVNRDRPIQKGKAALLVIDVQNGTCGPEESTSRPEFREALTKRLLPNVSRLLRAFRMARLEVIFTVIENLTADGRDRSLDYKLSNMGFPRGSTHTHTHTHTHTQMDRQDETG